MAGNSDKYAFLKMQAPPAYVAGLGRGAAGFTTRSDIGPAREGPSAEAIAAAQEARGEAPDDDDSEQYQDPEQETGLFAGMVYEKDDEEADKIYELVDARMDERRRAKREAREREEEEKYLRENPRIQEKFADLKRGLASVSAEEWENLPEVGNLTGKKRKKTFDRMYAVPDSVLLTSRDKNAVDSSIGTESEPGTGAANFVEIGQANKSMLSMKLDQVKDSVSGSTTIDPKGYLTSLDSIIHKTQAEIGDTKKGRTLLQSLIKTNPSHAPGWIAASELEKVAGKIVAARKVIAEGCEKCPKSEDVWLQAARLNTNDNAKVILANAVQHIPQSVKIWLAAVDLEKDDKSKKRVLRKALEHIPNSVRLWKETVNLETEVADARVLLSHAVEVIPLSTELWLTLARVETPDNARKVLNKARRAIPTSHEIWIAAARLQEEFPTGDESIPNEQRVDAVMQMGCQRLRQAGVELSREEWIKEALRCEEDGSLLTARAIVNATIHQDIDEDQRLETWVEDAQSALATSHIATARAMLAYALRVFPQKQALWRRAADLEKKHGSRETLLALLDRAVQACPQAEVLWLMSAKEKWMGGDVPGARNVLEEAFKANKESEQIWLAAVKLEAENDSLPAARQLMARARTVANTDRIWIKAAAFERLHSSPSDALNTVNEALTKFPSTDKLHMIKGQILSSQGEVGGAREAYQLGTKKCPKSIALWLLASRLEEGAGLAIKSRALLERARHNNPNNAELWLESCRLEQRCGAESQAKTIMAKALKECPSSGLLWSESVWLEARPQRKTKSVDALKKSNNDPLVLCTVARLFWTERKLDKARAWFERAVNANPDLGDVWAWFLRFEQQHGSKEQQESVVSRCIAAEPHHAEAWQRVSKDPANARLRTGEVLRLVAAELAQ
ncbi:uncharacterized protein L969DRAFT_87027 [Mixia osmundae IAM 14324]|uniref:PRP1 splicing factor N-terminal domain-containing protein n=1 Tax=Mixia osmundae (strain CBS 9802 / IAM 14324 / JCM 22182 / KY 12970) TaxID=764103 RepID=G7E6K2_MIXOS|nr:uncharacterized protein L969DRAFT_87027 [Mixia osmundae IAM 14324]KEI40380.1 hypothetical protein L969DRAFT_87027 [Mixia osmundae IAM 14324]GAA98462.1 hypothetical protein E5Q_05148 [Mixia osmundae IAM 14324]